MVLSTLAPLWAGIHLSGSAHLQTGLSAVPLCHPVKGDQELLMV